MNRWRWTVLLWLDWRLLVNRVRTVRHNPRRLIPWLIFLIWLIPSFVSRIWIGSHAVRGPIGPTAEQLLSPIGALVPGVALLVLGLVVWRASGTPPAAFQSAADARFVIGAGFDSRAVFAWLSLRTARRLIISFVLLLVLMQVVYLPFLGISFSSAMSVTLGFVLFGGMVFGARLLAFNLRRAARLVPVAQIGFVATAIGTVAFLASLAQVTGMTPWPAAVTDASSSLPPGTWVLQAFKGDPAALLELFASAVTLTVAAIALAGDCYPELWATSSRVIAVRQAVKARGGAFAVFGVRPRALGQAQDKRTRPVKSESDARVPGGAFTVLWKEWLNVRRGRGGMQLQIGLFVVAALLGLIVGLAAARHSAAAGVIGANVVLLLLVWSWASSVQLGRDLGNPLWWLSTATLSSRLAVWSFARGVRFALPLAVFIEFAIGAWGHDLWALLLAPAAPLLLCWMSQATGLAGYALLPAQTDYRLALTIRMFALYATFIPLGVAIIPGAILHNLVVLVALPALVATGMIAGLIGFATWRIAGNGLAFAREERH